MKRFQKFGRPNAVDPALNKYPADVEQQQDHRIIAWPVERHRGSARRCALTKRVCDLDRHPPNVACAAVEKELAILRPLECRPPLTDKAANARAFGVVR